MRFSTSLTLLRLSPCHSRRPWHWADVTRRRWATCRPQMVSCVADPNSQLLRWKLPQINSINFYVPNVCLQLFTTVSNCLNLFTTGYNCSTCTCNHVLTWKLHCQPSLRYITQPSPSVALSSSACMSLVTSSHSMPGRVELASGRRLYRLQPSSRTHIRAHWVAYSTTVVRRTAPLPRAFL